MGADPLPRALGWASAGLGIPMLAAPGRLGQVIGVNDTPQYRAVTMIVGVRELTAAGGLLGRSSPAWLWARAAGDVMDLGMLAAALRNPDRRGRTATAAAAVAGILGFDLYAAVTRSRRQAVADLHATTTVTCSPQEAYHLWRHLENLAGFMAHVDEVRTKGQGLSHWRVSAPFGRSVEWDAEITEDVPGERIAWRSVGGAAIGNEGEILFAAAPRQGCEIHVRLRYTVPGGRLGEAVARYFGEEPRQQLDDDLRRFKQVAETGEVVRSEGAPSGKRARREFPQRPARPLSEKELEELRS